MKHSYELMAIISSRITDGEIEKRLLALKELLGAEIFYEERWGMRPFAYQIKGQEKGFYIVLNFHFDPDAILELEQTLKLFPDLLRFLIVRLPENYKPMTLKEIEEGLEKLRKEKADKRVGMRREDPKDQKPKVESVPVPKPLPPAEKPESKGKTLQDKLNDIMSDDDLGL